jgi:AcrR family transcriptional regulator
MSSTGIRERKKQQTRLLIADTAAALFSQRGYDAVTVLDVARAADVSEQTVYNYFPTKECLVLDRDAEFEERLGRLVRERTPGSTPANALKTEALALVARIGSVPPDRARGSLIYLAQTSATVRLRCLEMTERHGQAIAAAISGTSPNLTSRSVANLQGQALAWVFQTIIDEAGRRLVEHDPVTKIKRDLTNIVEDMIASLDAWMTARV